MSEHLEAQQTIDRLWQQASDAAEASEYALAEQLSLEALSLIERFGTLDQRVMILYNVGIVQGIQGKALEAMGAFTQLLSLRDEPKLQERLPEAPPAAAASLVAAHARLAGLARVLSAATPVELHRLVDEGQTLAESLGMHHLEPLFRYERGIILTLETRIAEAIHELEVALAQLRRSKAPRDLLPSQGELLRVLGQLYLMTGDVKRALAYFDSLRELDDVRPDEYAGALVGLAQVHWSASEHIAAEHWAREALSAPGTEHNFGLQLNSRTFLMFALLSQGKTAEGLAQIRALQRQSRQTRIQLPAMIGGLGSVWVTVVRILQTLGVERFDLTEDDLPDIDPPADPELQRRLRVLIHRGVTRWARTKAYFASEPLQHLWGVFGEMLEPLGVMLTTLALHLGITIEADLDELAALEGFALVDRAMDAGEHERAVAMLGAIAEEARAAGNWSRCAETLFRQAEIWGDNENLAMAIEVHQQLIALAPLLPPAQQGREPSRYISLAYAFSCDYRRQTQEGPAPELLQQLDQGLAYLDEVNRPEWAHAIQLERGRCLADLGRDAEALEAFQEALRLSREDSFGTGYTLASHLRWLGEHAEKIGDNQLAIACLHERYELDGGAPHRQLGYAVRLVTLLAHAEHWEEFEAWAMHACDLALAHGDAEQRSALLEALGASLEASAAVHADRPCRHTARRFWRLADVQGDEEQRRYVALFGAAAAAVRTLSALDLLPHELGDDLPLTGSADQLSPAERRRGRRLLAVVSGWLARCEPGQDADEDYTTYYGQLGTLHTRLQQWLSEGTGDG